MRLTAATRRLAGYAVLVGVGGMLALGGLAVVQRPGPLPDARDIVVPRGSSDMVADALRRAGVLRDVSVFRALAAATAWRGRLRSGEFAFPAHADMLTVLDVLRLARPVEHRLTIPEGMTAWRIGEVVAGAAAMSGQITLPGEGEVLPETYAYERGTTGDAVLDRARQAMREVVARVWRERDAGLPLRSPSDLVVLASLVERETHLAAERPLVARVFLNRLQLGIRLQSDPTVVFGESGGRGELPAALGRDALLRAGPYNTYGAAGLPAGPICAPGLASLLGVAHPARSDALYFVADGTGGHVFARSLAEHARNVARYRALSR